MARSVLETVLAVELAVEFALMVRDGPALGLEPTRQLAQGMPQLGSVDTKLLVESVLVGESVVVLDLEWAGI